MEFIEKYKTRKNNIESDYINACLLIKSYADASDLNIAEMANAMKFIKLHMNVDTYNFNDYFEYAINDKSILENLLNDISSYGQLYKGSIKEETYRKYKNVKIKISDLTSFKDISYPPIPIGENHKDNKNKTLNEIKADEMQDLINTFEELHGVKSMYNRPYFSPFEACCLIAGELPRHMSEKIGAFDVCKEWDYLAAKDYVKKAFDDGRLFLTDECLGIPSIRLKVILLEDKKVIEGFNDDILLEIYNEYISPVIHINSHDSLFSKDSEKIVIKVPDEYKDNLLNSYPMVLERKLKELQDKTNQNDKTTTTDKAYSLIAVLKNLLLNPDITESYFANSDNNNAKKAPIQGELSRTIKEMKIAGLSKRNVDDLFSIANDVLDEVIKRTEI